MKRLILLLTLFIVSPSLFSVSPDMDNLNILINENKIHFEFINVVLSNLIKPQAEPEKLTDYANTKIKPEAAAKRIIDKDDSFYYGKFLEANQKDFEGNLLYFRGDYGEAHKPLKEAQGKIKELYEDALERHTEHTRVLVAYAAQRIIKSNDYSSKHLMKLAFRDLKIAEDYYQLGWNQAPYQFRNKISLYEDGFRASRRARRLTILALMNFKTANEDKNTYKKQSLSELHNSVNEGKVNDYEYIKVTLRNFIENKIIEGKISTTVTFPRPKGATDYEFKANNSGTLDLMEMLDDCYAIITYNRISILDETNNVIRKDSPGPVTPESNAKPAPATGAGTSQPVKSTPATNPPTNTNTGSPVDSLQKKE
ncbi:MAG TPA: hypothetical protein PLX69_12560 [Leptospiraceae bacterium]|nr:hypothetical protein [Leptospiraceae bacterium]HRG75383.1 hypothetical protein [Leptospiraceae bacterium]